MIGSTPSAAASSGCNQMQPHCALARSAATKRYAILDTPKEAAFDDIVDLAAMILDVPFAAIGFFDERRQWLKAEVGLGIGQTPIEHSFCLHAINQDSMLIVPDTAEDERFAANPFVTGEPGLRFYAGTSILANDGTPIGTLCVLDRAPRPEGLSKAHRTALQTLAKQVETQLELRCAISQRDEWATEQRKLTRELRHIADHDALTGLPNRTAFHVALPDILATASRSATRVAMMLIDVDHFKQVNDAGGHDAGDALLKAFGARLEEVTRSGDIVARLGGDEFGVILHDVRDVHDLRRALASLASRLREPLEYAGRIIDCNASVGVALYPDHARTAETLAKCSDLALAAAKLDRGQPVIFHQELGDAFQQEAKSLSIARAAVEQREIVPYYQPKIDLMTGEIAGYEALARWRRGDRAIACPDMLAQAFGTPKLAREASKQMMTQVLDDVRHWMNIGMRFGHVAINSCAADFASNDFAERLLAALSDRQIDPRSIELEVTEGVFLGRGAHHVARALELLSTAGIRVALDDFGTGFASLTHLKQFPVDAIKVDMSFVAGIGTNADDAAIVRAVLGLGDSLGIETIAEGIETREQAAFVRAYGCRLGQGFLYGRAAPAAALSGLTQRPEWKDAA